MTARPRSHALFAAAQRRIPGGVNSPVRAFRGVGGEPFFVERAEGSRLHDVDGHEYIDYVGTWGPAILGHAPRIVLEMGAVLWHGYSNFEQSAEAAALNIGGTKELGLQIYTRYIYGF